MKLLKIKLPFLILISFFFFTLSDLFINCSYSQTSNDVMSDPAQKYEELFKLKTPENIENSIQPPSNDMAQIPEAMVVPEPEIMVAPEPEIIAQDNTKDLLPKLNPTLFNNWVLLNDTEIWTPEKDLPQFITHDKDVLKELGITKAIRQSYQNENSIVDIVIYRFMDFSGAYSAFTVLHNGGPTKLKVGKHASEDEKSVTFWKGNYFVDIHVSLQNDESAKGFVVLASQEVSKNILIEQLPPVVAIQFPALNRIQGSEKYCLGPLCCKKYFSSVLSEINYDEFELLDSGGVITAEYKFSNNSKETIILFLTRYIKKETAELIFNKLKTQFELRVTKAKEDKTNKDAKEMDIDIDLEDSTVKIKNKKNDFTMLKQKGNLLAIAYGITDRKNGEKILSLIPWPIEITKPTNSLTETNNTQNVNP